MLKYSIRLSDGTIKQNELVWREKYLSPDLSFVSGVTSQDYHLDKFNKIAVSNTYSNTPTTVLPLETNNVTRQGYVIMKDKVYQVYSSTTYDNISESSTTYNYIFINGKYYYEKDGKFVIDNWLSATNESVSAVTVSANSEGGETKIDTIAWIEDGLVSIDGNEYIYDFEGNGIKYIGKGDILSANQITNCSEISSYTYSSTSLYDYVTKFKLTKEKEIDEPFNNITFSKYYYYVKYKDTYLNIRKEDNKFYCDVPDGLISGSSAISTSAYSVYYSEDLDEATSEGTTPITGRTFDVLRENTCYIIIQDDVYYVNSDVLNANDGNKIAIYFKNDNIDINVGDTLMLINKTIDERTDTVYSGDSNGLFVVYDGKKKTVVDRAYDLVSIDGTYTDAEYVNGLKDGEDSLVKIGDEDVPMKIVSGETKLQRYGDVMTSSTTLSATVSSVTYDIETFSGVTINDVRHMVEGENGNFFITTSEDIRYPFTVIDVIGSSMVVCKPYLDKYDFTEEFIENMSKTICQDVVEDQISYTVYKKNKIFGSDEITSDLPFRYTKTPTSSDDYFNLFDNFTIYARDGFINIPLMLSTPQGNDLLLDDTIKRDFFDREKKKAINPIIDMEKDVYMPKSFEGAYSGSDTDFKEVEEIRINLHFRTRDLETWKVNEEYNDASVSALSNWFVTDFFPYSGLMESSGETLLNSSDVMGLLYFTNGDIFYQKSKVGKSFLRFSFYDSTDQQNQTLLHTSTVFMDEHRMFKRYIDNSRKGQYTFVRIKETEPDKDPSKEGGVKFLNKIAVNSEWYSGNTSEFDYKNVRIDENHRVGSEFIIKNKYETDTSSEGYYIYIFREYSENLSPKPIYMKVEFNHAGVGRTIPFIIPMHWSGGTETENYNKFPASALTFTSNEDMIELKKGIKLEDAYAQTYIPLYAVYDFKNKDYAYVFDTRYVNVKDGVATLNLFEIKYANDQESDDDIQKAMTYKRQPTAKINVNEKQFPPQDKICGV